MGFSICSRRLQEPWPALKAVHAPSGRAAVPSRRPVLCCPNPGGSPGLGTGVGSTADWIPKMHTADKGNGAPEEAAAPIRGGPLVPGGSVGPHRFQASGQRGAEAPTAPGPALSARWLWEACHPRSDGPFCPPNPSRTGPRPQETRFGGPDVATRELTRLTLSSLYSLSPVTTDMLAFPPRQLPTA